MGTVRLLTADGCKIEVKSAAYLQSWHQKKLCPISFSIRESRAWDADRCEFATERKRQAGIYVFALLHHHDKETLDPLSLDQWSFLVVATERLNQCFPTRRSVSLKALRTLCPKPIGFEQLASVLRGSRGEVLPENVV
jgi:hypothetical protein